MCADVHILTWLAPKGKGRSRKLHHIVENDIASTVTTKKKGRNWAKARIFIGANNAISADNATDQDPS